MGLKRRSPRLVRVAERLIAAMVAGHAARLKLLLDREAVMRRWGWRSTESAGSRVLVIERLLEDASHWHEPNLETHKVVCEGDCVAVEFRVGVERDGVRFHHNRSVFFTFAGRKVASIDLYCAEPVPIEPRHDRIVPASLEDCDLDRELDVQRLRGDFRLWITQGRRCRFTPRERVAGSVAGDSMLNNSVQLTRWSAAEVDDKIVKVIEWHRRRDLGFVWNVSRFDTPADLAQRLRAHGLVHAGVASSRILRLPGASPIPKSPGVNVQSLDGSNDELIETALRISGRAFSWSDAQIETRRRWWFALLRNQCLPFRQLHYLARIDGEPVGFARLSLNAGIANLDGAATLPEYRRRGVYTTLLSRRLDEAQSRGYEVASVVAFPMSLPVVHGHGFEERAQVDIYAWMPVMDPEAIAKLVPAHPG